MPSDAVVEGVSGAVGGIVATVATYPLMTVNTLQAMRSKVEQKPTDAETGQQQKQEAQRCRRGTLAEMAEVVREGGWPALFSGLEASLIGTTVSQGIYFYLYSLLRRLAVLRRAAAEAAAAAAASGGTAAAGQLVASAAVDVRSANITVAESLLVASLAGMGNVLLTNPIWMIATRMQAQSRTKQAAAGADGEAEVPLGKPHIVAVARQVYGEYGVAGFWNGTAASLLMVVNPTLQYALYEWLTAARSRLRRANGSGSGKAAPRASAAEVFLLSALAKAGATLVTYPMMNIKTRMYTARRGTDAGAGAGGAGILAAALGILRQEGPAGFYRGLRTKIVQSVLAAALLFVAKEKITEATRRTLAAAAGEQRKRLTALA